MIDLKRIKRVFNPFFILKLASSFGAQLVSLFLIYLLAPDEYGQLALVLTVAQFMYILTTGWTEPTVINLGTRECEENGSYKNIVYYRFIIVIFCWILVSLFFIICKSNVISLIKDDSYYWMTYLLFSAFSLQSLFNQLLYPAKKNLLQATFDITLTILLLIITFVYVRTVKTYITTQFFLYFFYAVIVGTLYGIYARREKFNFNKLDFFKTLRFSIWQILGVLGIYLTNLGVNYVYSIENVPIADIGLYNVAYKLFSEFTPIFSICVIIIPQWIYGTQDKEKLMKQIPRRVVLGVTILSVAYLLIFWLLRPLLEIINKTDYIQAVNYYLCLFPAFIFMSYGQLMQLIIMTTPDFKHIQYATLFQGVLLVLSCLAFVYLWGIMGAIISVTLSFLGKALYLYVIYHSSAKFMILNNVNYE